MTAPTITPTAIDAMVFIDAIQVVGRHRRDLGNVRELADSIVDVGLLNPVTLTRDDRLIAGERRLAACRLLGWESIPVRFIDSLDDAARLLRAERDENRCRKDMLPSELASLGEALYAIEAAAAKTRQREHGGTAPGRCANTQGTRTPSDDGGPCKATDAIGEVLGMAGRTYQELRYVHQIATSSEAPEEERTLARNALDAMDQGKGVAGEARRLRAKLRTKREVREVVAAAMTDPPSEDGAGTAEGSAESWIPPVNDGSPRAVEQRRRVIQQMAEKGYSSDQMGERLGMRAATVRKHARDADIQIPADQAMGLRTRKGIDSNRVVRETVQALDGLVMGVGLIDFDELDPAEVENWTASLSESLRVLNRLNKQLKERVQ